MMSIAIIAIGYNRPQCLSRLLASLTQAKYDGEEVALIVSIDAGGNEAVENVAAEYVWPFGEKRTVIQPQRLGLRKHILQCGEYTAQFDAVIILEDDLYVSPLFYRFASQAIAKYGNDHDIAGVSLYSHLWNVNCSQPFVAEQDGTDAYFFQFAQSWGQIWNKRMWNEFHHWYIDNAAHGCNGDDIPDYVKNWPESSWLKYHIAYVIRRNKYFVYPHVSLTTNCGDVGQHAARPSTTFQVPLLWGDKNEFLLPALEDECVVYDAFFERRGLGKQLQVMDSELCVDLYGTKHNRAGQRYWLTMERRRHKSLASFGLGMRPHEVNVKLGMPGSDIFLYDTKAQPKAATRQRRNDNSLTRTLYDIRAVPGKDLLRVALHHLGAAIKRRIQRLWGQ